jgi:hypothetical protein
MRRDDVSRQSCILECLKRVSVKDSTGKDLRNFESPSFRHRFQVIMMSGTPARVLAVTKLLKESDVLVLSGYETCIGA